MTKNKLKKDLELIHRHLTRAEVVMQKIATKLNINQHKGVESAIKDVEELLKMFEEKEDVSKTEN